MEYSMVYLLSLRLGLEIYYRINYGSNGIGRGRYIYDGEPKTNEIPSAIDGTTYGKEPVHEVSITKDFI